MSSNVNAGHTFICRIWLSSHVDSSLKIKSMENGGRLMAWTSLSLRPSQRNQTHWANITSSLACWPCSAMVCNRGWISVHDLWKNQLIYSPFPQSFHSIPFPYTKCEILSLFVYCIFALGHHRAFEWTRNYHMKLYRMAGIKRSHVKILRTTRAVAELKLWAPMEYTTPDFSSFTLTLNEPAVFDIAECC